MSEREKDEILQDWVTRLAEQLGVPLDQVPVDDILALAGVAAHRVIRPAAPLTTYIVGFAAGLAAAGGRTDRPGPVMGVYDDAARRLAEKVASERDAAGGSTERAGADGGSTGTSDAPVQRGTDGGVTGEPAP
ncbi:hypothetical protein GCM10011512_01260 [Tersicoccus solisilvae]|uniref:DUF6457 domain-containing protein n=1 Tax=Tersicoccus solisilvae TaxID=1882339 RepID=A0ABQ1NJ39_9MICC|nr:DUF6457 domain-containing protein [Tersicoccus solisilvae]GGC78434.1 hypothetical protein GCM10011512_01260 [Tersicoccus solisilvae]